MTGRLGINSNQGAQYQWARRHVVLRRRLDRLSSEIKARRSTMEMRMVARRGLTSLLYFVHHPYSNLCSVRLDGAVVMA